MSLVSCVECGHQVSDQAVACPSCGATIYNKKDQDRVGKNVRGFAVIGIAALIIVSGYNAYSEWSQRRETKRAEVAEYMRRNSLTPEQRIAEDKEKARTLAIEQARQKRMAAIEAAEEERKPFKGVCLVALKSVLNDPGAFSYIDSYGTRNTDTSYTIYIEGRAKNGFGALIHSTWVCEAEKIGNSVMAKSVQQLGR